MISKHADEISNRVPMLVEAARRNKQMKEVQWRIAALAPSTSQEEKDEILSECLGYVLDIVLLCHIFSYYDIHVLYLLPHALPFSLVIALNYYPPVC
jgi:hypothetical protein